GTHLHDGVDVRTQRLGHDVVQVKVYPALQRGNLPLDDLHGHGFLLRVAPVDVESRLDARCEQQRDASLAADLCGLQLSQFRDDLHDATRGVTQKVDRVFHPPG